MRNTERDCLSRDAHDDCQRHVVAELGDLARPRVSHVEDVLAHRLQRRSRQLE